MKAAGHRAQLERVTLRCVLHGSTGMYRNAFLHANEFNPGVASIIKADASGKAPRYSVREVGGLLLEKGSSECPKSIPPPHLPPLDRMGRRCAPVCAEKNCPHSPCREHHSPPCYCLRAQESDCPQSASQVPQLSVPFSSQPCTETLDTVPVPGHPKPGVR